LFANPWQLSAALSLVLLSGGCASDIARTVDPDRVCDAWGQIRVRKADKLTEGTAADIARNNAGREAFGCKYEAPAAVIAQR
jgi:hypothetical protein